MTFIDALRRRYMPTPEDTILGRYRSLFAELWSEYIVQGPFLEEGIQFQFGVHHARAFQFTRNSLRGENLAPDLRRALDPYMESLEPQMVSWAAEAINRDPDWCLEGYRRYVCSESSDRLGVPPIGRAYREAAGQDPGPLW